MDMDLDPEDRWDEDQVGDRRLRRGEDVVGHVSYGAC